MKFAVAVLIALCLFCGGVAQVAAAAPDLVHERAVLANYNAAYVKAKAAYEKGRSAAHKKTYLIATVRLGTSTMVSPALPSKAKYRLALKYYREALKLDPSNVEAKHNAKMLEDIYRSLGRPIPK